MQLSEASSGLLLNVWGLLFTEQISKTLNVSVNQKTRQSICLKTCGGAIEMLSHVFETLGRVFQGLRENLKLSWEFESSTACWRYNTVHTLTTSHVKRCISCTESLKPSLSLLKHLSENPSDTKYVFSGSIVFNLWLIYCSEDKCIS